MSAVSAKGRVSEDEIRKKWPLHWMVWNDSHQALERTLKSDPESELEKEDPRGRTPLHLAVTLGKVACADVLLQHGANTLAENRHHWSVLNEAVCSGRPDLIGLVLGYRDQQLHQITTRDIPIMLDKLRNAPDYYIEMKWEFQSWIPFVSRMCPSDVCKIWKKGTTVRVDTTLVGFEKMTWQRGHQTLIFQATPTGHRVCDINHGERTVWEKEFKITERDPVQTLMSQEMDVLHRMSSPVVTTNLNTDTIAFQRQKSGFWGFRSERTDEINGYKSKVFSAVGLDIETRTRVEHLPETDKHKHKSINPLQDFLGASQDHASSTNPAIEAPPTTVVPVQTQPLNTIEEYFTEPQDKDEYDGIGRPPEVQTRMQKLKANVCLAEDFPMNLRDHVMPIIDLMALNTPHFAKIKDFINLQMPSGFPIKFEIPLFHVMSAKVTFGNLNGRASSVPHVTVTAVKEDVGSSPVVTPTSTSPGSDRRIRFRGNSESSADKPPSRPTLCFVEEDDTVREVEKCEISDDCFALPAGYRKLHTGGRGMVDQEEELLQMAIQQSLMDQERQQSQQLASEDDSKVEAGSKMETGSKVKSKEKSEEEEKLSLQEALKDRDISDPDLQAAYRASMGMPSLGHSSGNGHPGMRGGVRSEDDELQLALALSRELSLEEERRKRGEQEEDEEFQRVLRLSLQDK